ncbi:unnamed protein product [Brassicogethes aeneus]|uniref:Transmembrane protein 127 transmembrane region domain-containing protein n=1 Tax=Brassicogethes aeneus TaxID=1431903 RepID=A0A9P0FKU8_BRAAE|nr:unnamed protein product [Brassicogethes aeneus]
MTCWHNFRQILTPKNEDVNFISATFHLVTITLISMSMVDLNWFVISGNVCVPYLTLGQFFWFGYNNSPAFSDEYKCVTPETVNLMRITILLCFMAILFALFGYVIDIIGSKNLVYRLSRRYAVPGTCAVFWIMAIISLSYYTILLMEDSLASHYSKSYFNVTYGLGFYLLASAGINSSIGIIYNLILSHNPSGYQRDDDACILETSDNDLDTFNSPTPPPPYHIPPLHYSIAPPPYTP